MRIAALLLLCGVATSQSPAPATGTITVSKLPDRDARIEVRAKGANARSAHRVFHLTPSPLEAKPVAAEGSLCRTSTEGDVLCSFRVAETFLAEPVCLLLMARKPASPDVVESYQPVLAGMVGKTTDTVTMAVNFRTVLFSVPHAKLHVPGALVADNFDGDSIDLGVWRIWQQDAGLMVEQKQGNLVVSGYTGQARRVPGTAGHRFTGLVSKRRFMPADTVLIAKIRIPGGLKSSSGLERYMVHHCASAPDYYTELILGRERDGRRGWAFLSSSQYAPRSDYKPAPVEDWSPDSWQTIRIEHDSATQISRASLWSDAKGGWQAVGEPQKLFMSAAQVELKVNIPPDGLAVEARFDDCRLYRRAETAPVKFIVYKQPSPGFGTEGVKVRLLQEDGVKPLGECVTDRDGVCSITLSSQVTYPAGALIRLERNGQDLGSTVIRRDGVAGLYPGDMWAVNAPVK